MTDDVSRETPFAFGDAVRVKEIDGPTMSVASIEGDNIGCIWFDAALHRQSGMFDSRSLEATTRTGLAVRATTTKRKSET